MNREDIQQLAKLARLHIADDQADEVTNRISTVLALVDQLSAVDTEGVAPMAHPLDAVQILRADEITEPNVREQMQAIAPATEDGLFLVPKVID
ncbi:Asp-tRNA(Asn)/Glu-tRNA(Gln) amidotransferase subunit GatC [Marinagarivorans algicola]|uniref:Asp-tRNA(Asn)/Glu-tRNA(Gln) amidotransferase subunit GatC n=1 Tax=Marinagarivorans algicola TaxID=1513270 RepID=UPI0006B8DAB4|nr:Asp-tRNA(Asn)/Glu-tRNA(Gln) amidotransferase subunit GatC [Marinagarivorans algicola]